MIRALGPFVLLVFVGCSSEATGVQNAPCVTPSSSYTVHFEEKSGGTCGRIPDAVATTNAEGNFQQQAGCTGTRTVQGCNVVFTSYACTPAAGTTTTITGQVTWKSDGTSGTGTVDVSVASGGATCKSSYVVTYTRQ